jgi:hypothetical protein
MGQEKRGEGKVMVSVVQVHFENTLKAFANVSPGLECSDNPGVKQL